MILLTTSPSQFVRRYSVISLLGLLLCGCGGSGSNDNTVSSIGIDGSGAPASATAGTIQGFGSVIVNGVRYNTDSASIEISGQTALESELEVGDYVTIVGSVNTDGSSGVATSIRLQHNVIGSIDSISASTDSFSVLGQTVFVNADTFYDDLITPRSLSGLSLDLTVEVSGFTRANGDIVATRISIADGETDEIFGEISNLDESIQQFSLEEITIDYSGLDLQATLTEGAFVVVEGIEISEGVFTAAALELNLDYFDFEEEIDEFGFEGIIDEFVDVDNFSVSGIPSRVSDSIDYINGSESDLAIDALIALEGTFDDNDELVITLIEFFEESDLTLLGEVEAVTTVDGEIITGTVTVQGELITITEDTAFEDYSDERDGNFNLGDINVGDFIFITGFQSENEDRFIASLIEREDEEDEELNNVEVQGIATVSNDELSIFGYEIILTEETELFIGEDAVSEQAFLAQADGARIEVSGVVEIAESDTVIATFVELLLNGE